MKKAISLKGEKVTLASCTRELWHEFNRGYAVDPMMSTVPYTYDFERAEAAFHVKTGDATRLYFTIMHGGGVIGEIYLKHMDREQKTTEFGIALMDDSVKGKGFGTEAICLLVDYALETLGFETILADSVHGNTRSQHVLEKIGFAYTHADSIFKYYALKRDGVASLT